MRNRRVLLQFQWGYRSLLRLRNQTSWLPIWLVVVCNRHCRTYRRCTHAFTLTYTGLPWVAAQQTPPHDPPRTTPRRVLLVPTSLLSVSRLATAARSLTRSSASRPAGLPASHALSGMRFAIIMATTRHNITATTMMMNHLGVLTTVLRLIDTSIHLSGTLNLHVDERNGWYCMSAYTFIFKTGAKQRANNMTVDYRHSFSCMITNIRSNAGIGVS